jgi:hypothetical protein
LSQQIGKIRAVIGELNFAILIIAFPSYFFMLLLEPSHLINAGGKKNAKI